MKGSTKYITLIILLAAIGVGFYMILLKPKMEEIKTLNSEIMKARDRLDELIFIKKNEEKIKLAIENEKSEMEKLRVLLPKDQDIARLLVQFHEFGRENNVEISNLTFVGGAGGKDFSKARLMERQGYYEMQVNFSFSERFKRALEVLKALENFPRILHIKKVSVTYGAGFRRPIGEETGPRILNFNFNASVFTAKEP